VCAALPLLLLEGVEETRKKCQQYNRIMFQDQMQEFPITKYNANYRITYSNNLPAEL